MSEFKSIETQEELDRIIGERLARQKEKYADYDELKELVSSLESEKATLQEAVAKANQTAADFEGQIAGYQSEIKGLKSERLKTAVALKHGLPLAFADRLQGEDEESLAADAERFAGLFKSVEPTPPLKDIEPEHIDGKDAGWRQAVRELTKGD